MNIINLRAKETIPKLFLKFLTSNFVNLIIFQTYLDHRNTTNNNPVTEKAKVYFYSPKNGLNGKKCTNRVMENRAAEG